MNQPKTILAVLAHPDDESFGLGGTLALYARKGYDTYYLCATRGEAGTVDEEHLNGFKDTAELRTNELMRAAKVLGLKGVFFLGYRDSGMPGTEENQHPNAQINHAVEEVAGHIVKYMRELKPDIVITHDPIGGYRHPDHIQLHKATKLAFERADDASFHPEAGVPFKPRALYYQVFPRGILKWSVRLMRLLGKDPTKYGRNEDVNLQALTEVDFPIHVRLDIRSVLEIKREAGVQHASQGGGQIRRGWLGFFARLFREREEFMRAYPPVADGRYKVASDLFDGIKTTES
ncbi:MAG TPA: PIG-L deacetylase family protein [Anaerolineales bacterium]|nr:PIG-L deacetylase family protein [Anaerolineales bacterium]